MSHDIAIIGGGLSGLAAAAELAAADIDFDLFESAPQLGGRVYTDDIDGFALDRGFQVLLTAYPDAQILFNYDDLDLGRFYPGALVQLRDDRHRLADPFRHPLDGARTLFEPIGSVADKLRIARLRARLVAGSGGHWQRSNVTTRRALSEEYGFSDQMIRQFFEPFIGGITLDSSLESSRRVFDFVFEMFSTGHAALPAGGMQRLADQLASRLPDDHLHTGVRIESAEGSDDSVTITPAGGDARTYRAAILAVPPWDLRELVDTPDLPDADRPHRRVGCVYFSAPDSPLDERMLVLDGTGTGPINNLSVPSDIADGYAPDGQSLISISVLDGDAPADGSLEQQVRRQANTWFGSQVDEWEHLRTYDIERALPDQSPMYMQIAQPSARLEQSLYIAGDYLETSSIQGALSTGRHAAATLLADLDVDSAA